MLHLIESTAARAKYEAHIADLNDLRNKTKLGAEAYGMEVIIKASMELKICPFMLLVTRLGAQLHGKKNLLNQRFEFRSSTSSQPSPLIA